MPTTCQISLGDRELAAVDRYVAERAGGMSREAALAEIVAAWAHERDKRQGETADEGLRPDELNASNDS